MDIIPRKPIWARHHDAVDSRLFDAIPQAISSWAIACGPTVAVIAEHILCPQGLTLRMHVRGEALDLLCTRVRQCLALGRHADVDCCAHDRPPPAG
jgi:hypothetical protein